MNKQYLMVKEFHQRFGHLVADHPTPLTDEQRRQRYWFMYEELQEFLNSSSVVDQADAMIDLIYFALGTMVNMGVEPERLFEIVHEANMSKFWQDGQPRWDKETGKVMKPPTWVDPYAQLHAEIHQQAIYADVAEIVCDPELPQKVLYPTAWRMLTVIILTAVFIILFLIGR